MQTPKESAAHLFERLIQENENDWEDFNGYSDEDDPDETEIWKYKDTNLAMIADQYIVENSLKEKESNFITLFRKFITDYAGIIKIDEFTLIDLDEFISFYLVREISFERIINVRFITQVYVNFLRWLELNYEFNTSAMVTRLEQGLESDLNLALELNQHYRREHSVIDGILEANNGKDDITEGVFEIVKIGDNGFFRMREILTKKEFINVRVDINFTASELEGFLFEGSLKQTLYGWRMIDIEFIYPSQARPFLR